MPKKHRPRYGSLQFWPRKRARRQYPRIRTWPLIAEPIPLAFAGYKAGMTHLIARIKGKKRFIPATVIECPPLKVFGIKFYNNGYNLGLLLAEKLDKDLARKIKLPKKKQEVNYENFTDVRLVVHTQPRLAKIGKKKPEIFEIALGGNKEEKLNLAKSLLGKEIKVSEIFKPIELVDVHAISKGKGTAGPVKRFGIGLKSHKSEKGRRTPGSLGPWTGAKQWRVAKAGQLGYFQRTEYNKQILLIDSDPKKINPKGGFPHYGLINNEYVLIKGSVPGPQKRLIIFKKPIRPNQDKIMQLEEINYISLESKQ